MDPDYGLLALCGAIFAMMILLNVLKRRTRRSGLNSYIRRHSSRTRRLVPKARVPPAEEPAEDEVDPED